MEKARITMFGCLALTCVLPASVASAGAPGIAFHYGANPPVEELSHFEQVVVEPRHMSLEKLAVLRGASVVHAYLSIGEMSREHPAHARLQESWIIGRNEAWDSSVLDPLQEGVRELLLSQAEALWADGYQGLFLDTLDSPLGVAAPASVRQARIQALVELLQDMHRRLPGVKLLLNRGFELFPEVAPLAHGLVAESLFAQWNAKARRYEPVPEEDRAWLVEKLDGLRRRHGLPVTVVDYVPPAERERARAVARDIHALGFTPYVTNSRLDMLGVGLLEVIPRRVLALHDGAEGEAAASSLHRYLAVPLEALGYVLEYRDVREPLPEEPLAGRYAGVVAWLADVPPRRHAALRAWLDGQCDAGVRVALLGELGFAREPAFLAKRGLAPVRLKGAPRLGRADALVGFEAPPALHARALPDFQAVAPEVRVHLSVEDASGQEAAAVVTGPCGGLALGPYVLEEGFAGQRRWVLEPFAFLEASLGAEPFPILDVTTENGRRVRVVHVEVTGYEPHSALLGLASLLSRHPLPTTLSLARSAPGGSQEHLLLMRLARPSQLVRVVPSTLLSDGLGYLSLENPSLTVLSPLLAPGTERGERIYAPLVDGRDYERLASPPYAYSRLVGVLERTERPRRLKPLGLAYPMEAFASPAGLRTFELLHAWVREQPSLPLWLDEYVERVEGFARATLARHLDGSWRLRGLGALRTVRVPPSLGWPELQRSRHVVGFLDAPQGRYVSLQGPEAGLVLGQEPPRGPALAWANAPVVSWSATPSLSLRLRGLVPVSLALAGVPSGCALVGPSGTIRGVPERGVLVFHFPRSDTGDARLVCP
jgi:hypothetical protein